MTPTNLRLFSLTVQEQLEVLLTKWESSMEKNAPVNAYYDLTTCTEEIIGIIGLGQRFGPSPRLLFFFLIPRAGCVRAGFHI